MTWHGTCDLPDNSMAMFAAALGTAAACQHPARSEQGPLENLAGVRSCISLYQQVLPEAPHLSSHTKKQAWQGVAVIIIQRARSVSI